MVKSLDCKPIKGWQRGALPSDSHLFIIIWYNNCVEEMRKDRLCMLIYYSLNNNIDCEKSGIIHAKLFSTKKMSGDVVV